MQPLRARALLLLFAALFLAACGRMGDPIPPGQALLAAPAKPELRGRDGALLLSWTAPGKTVGGGLAEPVRGYEIERVEYAPGEKSCQTCPSSPARFNRSKTTSWADTTVMPGYTYRYRVWAVDYRERVGLPSPWVEVEWREPPPMPELTVTGVHLGVLVGIGMDASAPLKPIGLAVYKDGQPLQRIPHGVKEAILKGFPNDKPVVLLFRWEAGSPDGWVAESLPQEVTVVPRDTTPPEPPHGTAAFPEKVGISLHWINPVAESAESYVIERAQVGGAWTELARIPGENLDYLDATALPGETYRYRVTPIDAAGNIGKPSTEARTRAGGGK